MCGRGRKDGRKKARSVAGYMQRKRGGAWRYFNKVGIDSSIS